MPSKSFSVSMGGAVMGTLLLDGAALLPGSPLPPPPDTPGPRRLSRSSRSRRRRSRDRDLERRRLGDLDRLRLRAMMVYEKYLKQKITIIIIPVFPYLVFIVEVQRIYTRSSQKRFYKTLFGPSSVPMTKSKFYFFSSGWYRYPVLLLLDSGTLS